jgi:hypothetical protein
MYTLIFKGVMVAVDVETVTDLNRLFGRGQYALVQTDLSVEEIETSKRVIEAACRSLNNRPPTWEVDVLTGGANE